MAQKFKSVVTQRERAKKYYDKTDELFNAGLKLSFYHVPSDQLVEFKAFITTLTDNFNQSWNSEKVIGRTDPFHNYENTERVINLGWKIVAASSEEAKENMQNISLLAMMNYPKYDQSIAETRKNIQNATAITESPLFRVKLMNLIYSTSGNLKGLPCRIDGFSFSHIIEDGYFANSANSDEDVRVYPKTIEASCTIYVIHDHALGWSSEKEFRGGDKYPYADPARVEPKQEFDTETTAPVSDEGELDVAEALRKIEEYGADFSKISNDPFGTIPEPDELREAGIIVDMVHPFETGEF